MIIRRLFSISNRSFFLKKPQFDVKRIIEMIPQYQTSIQNRELIEADSIIRSLQLLGERYQNIKEIDKVIADIQIQRKSIEAQIKKDKTKITEYSAALKALKEQYNDQNSKSSELKKKILETCKSLPNTLDPTVPLDAPQIEQWINPLKTHKTSEAQAHVDIMLKKNMLDLQTASNVTGMSWYYLLNDGARLQQALVAYALKKANENGFSSCVPPSITKKELIDACGFNPRDMNNERQIYALQDTNLGLVATAEIPLAGLGANKVLELNSGECSKKLVGVSRCYRAEAGARGKDTKGLYRVHEFTKVELFCWSKPETSAKVLEEIKQFQISVVEELGIPAKVLNMPSNDLGNPAFKKYDIEAWMPGRGKFGEISSASNCTDFQSRRLNTKYRDDNTGKLEYVHTLNGTAMAIPRVIVALVENFYDPSTGKISVPECLREFMNGQRYI
ncbi:ANM_HP_G0005570.mRNA.1.CDS.1 [Saccharomyces cerevisiae]|nr:ANM_HP_G0006260.mRNA.1.CDS.1 [Saccharomyces cerevisiae]CAI4967891.1 ANM_HP_G0138810.mRNA.1.CDS.1 [Saccharomyces cerevisiae]CAI5014705.1 ANM_HP_G0175390.mRNA.1.CDS.1 [Saccharomyces cerevisiae]CAI5029142.1 ANM_HP_G0188560.mRNA.1.CDS.1 [Saccharomyces cerevisiae]CAI5206866.1 ANM_HP_G0011720.mRNA.1.CDS.1 [Saccharomyces cerevisiae]